jgi:damage-control phosphatase, subfamily I
LKTYLDCIPCFVRQALGASRRLTDDVAVQETILRELIKCMSKLDLNKPPPYMAREIYRLIGEIVGKSDPFEEIKDQSNKIVLDLYPKLKQIIEDSSDPFVTATKLAIAGNVIDYGAKHDFDVNDIQRFADEAIHAQIPSEAMESFRRSVSQAENILYIGDNAGEIVFDRLLIEWLLPKEIIFVVRGAPIINDITMVDAEKTGMSNLVPIIDSGSDMPGIMLEMCSKTFKEAYERADLVIAKGMGNYETLSEEMKHIFFLLKVKCSVAADHTGHHIGSIIIKKNTEV